MESRFKLTMRTWDDVWKSTAWAKFAPDKLKQTLQRSARNQGELKAAGSSSTAEGNDIADADDSDGMKKKIAPAAVQVKKSRFRVVPHVQIDKPVAVVAPVQSKRSSPKPPLSSSSGSSDTDSDRLPAGLPMIESNLNELTMVESELKKLEREHEAKHQLLTPKNDGGSVEKTSSTADDGAVAGDGRKQQNHQQKRDDDGKKDKPASSKVGSRAAETHSKRLGWLKAFRRKSSADTSSETAPVAAQPPAPKPTAKNKQQTARSLSSANKQSSTRQQQRQRASARPRQQQHHSRVPAVNITPVSYNVQGIL